MSRRVCVGGLGRQGWQAGGGKWLGRAGSCRTGGGGEGGFVGPGVGCAHPPALIRDPDSFYPHSA
jgi:hypothetical protein